MERVRPMHLKGRITPFNEWMSEVGRYIIYNIPCKIKKYLNIQKTIMCYIMLALINTVHTQSTFQLRYKFQTFNYIQTDTNSQIELVV